MGNPINSYNTLALAFLGDSIYEAYIREMLIYSGIQKSDKLHKMAVKYVNAKSQSKAIKEILPTLTEEEAALVNRAKNHKTETKPKNVDVMTYKWATAMEALIGYLHLAKKDLRKEEIIKKTIEIIDEAKTN
ncbi:MAG: Mini-ribonuclease 3 [Anaerovoracaceae bacterium]